MQTSSIAAVDRILHSPELHVGIGLYSVFYFGLFPLIKLKFLTAELTFQLGFPAYGTRTCISLRLQMPRYQDISRQKTYSLEYI